MFSETPSEHYSKEKKSNGKIFCNHKWTDIDPIGVDINGGYHKCSKCGRQRYIYWGWHYIILKLLGKIN